MFQSQLLQTQSLLNINRTSYSSYNNPSYSSDIDLQYQLYSKYIQLSKQQIAIQQLIAIKDSQSLIQSLSSNLSNKDLSKDASSTMDSLVSYDDDFENSLVQQFSCIQKRSPRKITRKSTRQSVLKPMGRANEQFNQILCQIQRNCTQKTLNVVKSLLSQHKKNLSKIIQVQKKQKNMKKLQEKTEKLQQQNIIFKSRLNDVEQKLRNKEEQIKILKQKINQIKIIDKENIKSPNKPLSCTTKSISQDQSFIINNNTNSVNYSINPSHISNNSFCSTFLDQKQSYLKERINKVQSIQIKIQKLIESSVLQLSQQTCNKCCQMIKKIKQSVLTYRTYLEQEGQECDKLYNMLKSEVQNCLQDKKIEAQNF